MIRAISPVAALLLGAAILLTGQGLQGVLLPVRANLEGFPTLAIGFIGASYFLGFTLGCWKGSALIRNVGHVRVFAAMTALASASPLLQGLWVNLWSWGVLRALTGYCLAVIYVVIESWLNERSTDQNRGTVFSAYILINMTVLALGQQMLLLGDPLRLELFAATSVLVSLAAVPVALSTSQTPRDIEEAHLDFAYAFRKSKAGMIGSFTTGLVNGSFWALAPVFVGSVTSDVSMTAWFMTAGVLGGAAGQFPFGHLSDRVDRRYVMFGLVTCGMVVSMLIFLLQDSLTMSWILALGFAWGMFSFPLYTISVAHANDRADPSKFVMLSSALLLMYGIGAISGPLLASGVMAMAGVPGLYLFAALIQAGFGCYLVVRRIQRKTVGREQTGEFDDALAAVMTASRVYEHEYQESEMDSSKVNGMRDG
jgi:MFS family permease